MRIAAFLLATGLALAAVLPAWSDSSKPATPPNAQMQAVLDELAALGPKPVETLTPAEARKQPTAADAVLALLKKQGKDTAPEKVGAVADVTLPGPGGPIPAKLYTPAAGSGPFPLVVYWHGGGWVFADLKTYDSTPRALANAAGCAVLSCHYRQAPENPFPAAEEDALAAYQWAVGNAARLGADPRKVAVAGESAGGNLAAVVALRARDGGMPPPVHQLLVYPVTDVRFDTPSYRQYATAKPLNAGMMKWFAGHYLNGAPPSGTSAYAAPLRSQSFDKLPPATIVNAEIDPLRDDGVQYAEKLRAAGVPVEQRTVGGVTHEFFGMGAVLDDANQAVSFAAAGLKKSFGK